MSLFASPGRAVAAIMQLSLLLVTCVLFAARVQAQDSSRRILPDDPNLLYIGRWDKTNPNDYHGNWIGSYVRTKFSGTSVSVALGGSNGLDVSIDDEPFRVVVGGPGAVPLTTGPLSPGVHSLQVGVKGGGGWDFDGLVLDLGASTSEPVIRPIIEAIGDSISCGCFGPLEAAGNYNWLTAETLGCDHTQISWPGRALTTGYGCDGHDKNGLNTQYFLQNCFYDKPQGPWNFAVYTPRIIVINLGQNDGCGNEPDSVFTTSYTQFLKDIRSRFPKTEIIALRMFGGGHYGDDTRSVVDAIYTEGDHRVHYIDTTGWLSQTDFVDGIHPGIEGNVKVEQRLAPLLAPLVVESRHREFPEFLTAQAAVGG